MSGFIVNNYLTLYKIIFFTFLYFCHMNKNRIRRSKLYSFIVLIIYCISLVPSLIVHNHSDNNNHHNESSYCESLTENLKHHSDCSYEQHLNKAHKDCFLCDHYISYDHLSSFFMIESNNRPVIVKSYKVCDRVNSRESINLSNKSPPVLI